MALWQYDTYLIPHSRLLERFDPIPATVTEAQGQALHWDERHEPPADYTARLSAFLKPAPSWHDDVQIWGRELGNRVDVTTDHGAVQSIRVRLDAREATATPFLIGMVDFARHTGAVFVTDEGRLISPDVQVLLADLQQSPARRFVTDPPDQDPPHPRDATRDPDRPAAP